MCTVGDGVPTPVEGEEEKKGLMATSYYADLEERRIKNENLWKALMYPEEGAGEGRQQEEEEDREKQKKEQRDYTSG